MSDDLTNKLLAEISSNLENVTSSSPDAISIGFFNDVATERLQKIIEKSVLEARNKIKNKRDADPIPAVNNVASEVSKSSNKVATEIKNAANQQKKDIREYGGKLGSYFSKFKEIKDIFSPGNEFARNLFLASKAFEVGTGILKKVFEASVSYLDTAKDLSDAGLMIGSASGMLYRTVEGAYDRFSDGTADFNAIITHSANLAGIRLEDFGDKLKENSSFLTRMYSMGIEGTAEIGNLYATVAKKAGDMSQKNADTVVKQWAGAIQPLYTTEEIMSNKLNTSFDNLVETMNYFMKATGKSAENILKENEIKEKTLALERITAENPQIVSALKSVGYSDDMIMGALTGRITKELNMQLMNSPNFAAGFRNVQQMIQQHATDGYLNTDEGRQLFANTVLASVNNAQSDIRNIRNMSDYLTRRTYAGYDYIRQIEAVGRIRTDAINPNATILGQNSSQTAAVEASNELNRDTNKIVNDIKNILSPGMKNIAGILKIMDSVVSAGRWGTNLISSNPIANSLVGGLIWGGGAALAGWGAIHGIRAMMSGAGLGTMMSGAGAGIKSLFTVGGLKTAGLGLVKGGQVIAPIIAGGYTGSITGGWAGSHFESGGAGALAGGAVGGLSGAGVGAGVGAIFGGLVGLLGGPLGVAGGAAAGAKLGALLGGTAGTLTGSISGASRAGSQLEQSYYRGSSEGQPMYFNSPEIVGKLNQIQSVCQNLYSVACINSQRQVFVRMDNLSAENK